MQDKEDQDNLPETVDRAVVGIDYVLYEDLVGGLKEQAKFRGCEVSYVIGLLRDAITKAEEDLERHDL